MQTYEAQYLNVLSEILDRGTRKSNRTGVDTIFLPGHMLQFDLQDGFPLLTTKRMATKAIIGELLGFLRGYDSAAKFRELGCSIWDANANENESWLRNPARLGPDDLGRVYGVQWRNWGFQIDQLKIAIEKLYRNPEDRRNIVTAWNPDELKVMALPPCHLLWQLIANPGARELHLTMYMRSCDMFLGVPFNIASYGLLLAIVSAVCGWRPRTVTMFLADAHIYVNHLEQCRLQLSRTPFSAPTLRILTAPMPDPKAALEEIERLEPDDFSIENYQSHSAIKAEMAV